MEVFEEPKYMEISVHELFFNLNNFRLLSPVENEEQAIIEMLRLKKVGPEKIKNIITDIVSTNLILEDFIVLIENEKYIVYDGNRRLTAIRLLENENLYLIKEEFNSLYKHIKNLQNNIDIDNLVISAKVYTDKKSVMNHVRKIHSGEQAGVGQISWGSIEKANFEKQTSNQTLTFSNLLLNKIKSVPKYEYLYKKIISSSLSTSIDRIFGFLVIKERIFGVGRGMNISLENKNNLDKVCEMIDYFIDNGGSVTDVYYKDQTDELFASIEPVESSKTIYDNEVQLTLDVSDTSNDTSLANDEVRIEDNTKENLPIPGEPSDTDEDISEIEIKIKENRRLPNPKSVKYLTSAYQVSKYYKRNSRINTIKRELSNLKYKKFKISAIFLIRALLETYTHEYIDFFANLDHKNELRMRGVARQREKREKSLQDLLYSDIKNHLKNIIKNYADTYELIETILSKNNNTALTQIINYYIHSTASTPDSNEILEAWEKSVIIINTLDTILFEQC